MKKIYLFTLLSILASYLYAQENQKDIIYRTDYEVVEAKIIEVSSTEVKYKDWGNLSGPTFVLRADEIGKIKFSNGQIKIYNTVNSTSNTIPQASSSSQNITTNQPQKNVQTRVNKYIRRNGQYYEYDGTYMRGNTYAEFLQNCPMAYSQYTSGYKVSAAGWALFGTGVTLDLTSLITILALGRTNAGITTISWIGAACEIASIPTLIVGYTRMHKSADTFNMSCRSQTYWSINTNQNGIGLALHF